MAQRMLSIKEVSELMGMGIHQTEKLVHSAGFPSIKIGGRYYIPEKEFEKWIKNNCYSSVPYKIE